MNKLTLASRFARAIAVLACVLAQWWPVATYAGWSPATGVAARALDDVDGVQGDGCRPLRGLGTVTIQRYDCAP